MSDIFEPDTPVEYTSPTKEAIPMMIDQIGIVLEAHSILLYRIYDLLSVIAYSADRKTAKAVMERHERGELVSPPAWLKQDQIDNPQE